MAKMKKSKFSSRKQKRKQLRQDKKQRKKEWHFGKGKKSNPDVGADGKKLHEKTSKKHSNNNLIKSSEKVEYVQSIQDEHCKELLQMERMRKILEKEMAVTRVEKLKEDNAAEDKEIKMLESKLKLKRKSEKSKLKSLADDGLDDLLNFVDRKEDEGTGGHFKEYDDSDFDDDLLKVTGKKIKRKTKKTKIEPLVDSDEAPDEFPSTKAGVAAAKRQKLNDNVAYESCEASTIESERVFSRKAEEKVTEKLQKHETSTKRKEAEQKGSSSEDDISDNSLSNFEEVESDSDESNDSEIISESEDEKLEALSNSKKGIDSTNSSSESDSLDSEADENSNDSYLKKKNKLKDSKALKGGQLLRRDDKDGAEGSSKHSKSISSNTKKVSVGNNSKVIEDNKSDNSILSGNESNEEEEKVRKNKKKADVWEDIYGRMRDKDGNVLNTYVAPQLRDESFSKGSEEKLIKLRKQMKGLLNRLAENNMASISSQMEQLYMSHSRNDMNETLWNLFQDSLIVETSSPERLIAEHSMLVAILSANIGGEISAHCLQQIVTNWHKLWSENPPVENKKTNNLLLLLSYFYHFKLLHCRLLFDILTLLLEKLEEKSVELVLLILRTVGFTLRKDEPVKLKELVLNVQRIANDSSSSSGSRARFMLDTVLAIKNNNMSKIPNYDPEYGERIKKTIKAFIRKGNYNAELNVTLEDLLKADERGRWWVVGSAWTGELPGEKEPVEAPKKEKTSSEKGFSNNLLELAKVQRMNTDTRRTVFCVLMSAEDYLDAFEKLLKLGLKGPSEREVMNVMLHCLTQEQGYNPYYAHLANKFCVCNRRYQVMIQFAVWDKIQDLNNLTSFQITNLAKFLGFLILEKSIPLSVLKVVQFAQLNKSSVKFIRQIMLCILLAESETAMTAAFSRVSASKELKLFREGLRLFLRQFVLKENKVTKNTDMSHLSMRVKMADSALISTERFNRKF